MNMQFTPPISIEKFAAYLEGNLTLDEIRDLSMVIENNAELKELVAANDITTETMENYSPLEMELTLELQMDDFRIPEIDNSDVSMLRLDENNTILEDKGSSLEVAVVGSEMNFCETILDDDIDLDVSEMSDIEEDSETFDSSMKLDTETD